MFFLQSISLERCAAYFRPWHNTAPAALGSCWPVNQGLYLFVFRNLGPSKYKHISSTVPYLVQLFRLFTPVHFDIGTPTNSLFAGQVLGRVGAGAAERGRAQAHAAGLRAALPAGPQGPVPHADDPRALFPCYGGRRPRSFIT